MGFRRAVFGGREAKTLRLQHGGSNDFLNNSRVFTLSSRSGTSEVSARELPKLLFQGPRPDCANGFQSEQDTCGKAYPAISRIASAQWLAHGLVTTRSAQVFPLASGSLPNASETLS